MNYTPAEGPGKVSMKTFAVLASSHAAVVVHCASGKGKDRKAIFSFHFVECVGGEFIVLKRKILTVFLDERPKEGKRTTEKNESSSDTEDVELQFMSRKYEKYTIFISHTERKAKRKDTRNGKEQF